MDGLIQPGQTLLMERGGAVVVVEKRLGEGGQGVVHQARIGDMPFAVKWLRPGPGNEEMRKSISGLIRGGRPPHRAFVWPIDLLSSDIVPGFGYLMPLLEPRFTSLAPILNMEIRPLVAHAGDHQPRAGRRVRRAAFVRAVLPRHQLR